MGELVVVERLSRAVQRDVDHTLGCVTACASTDSVLDIGCGEADVTAEPRSPRPRYLGRRYRRSPPRTRPDVPAVRRADARRPRQPVRCRRAVVRAAPRAERAEAGSRWRGAPDLSSHAARHRGHAAQRVRSVDEQPPRRGVPQEDQLDRAVRLLLADRVGAFFAREHFEVLKSRRLSRLCRDPLQPYARSFFVLRRLAEVHDHVRAVPKSAEQRVQRD